ncbi:MAG: methyltransferase domain-containing protein [Sphingomonas paucimobilis]
MTDARVHAWLAVRGPLERQLAPIGRAVIDRLALLPGEHVLDLGCGIARTTETLADIVGPGGRVTGVDPLHAAIEVRLPETAHLPHVDHIVGDAQTLTFDGRYDAAFSRFGVMFFADPVTAFANIREALRPGGRFGFVCWRSLADNDLDAFPLHAASPCLPRELVADAERADHFSFADPDFLFKTLEAAGFTGITVEPVDIATCAGSLTDTIDLSLRFGSLGRIVREHPDYRTEAEALLEAAFHARSGSCDPVLRAATWIVRATTPPR